MYKKIFILLLLSVIITGVFSNENKNEKLVLGVSDAIDLALKNNLDIETERLKLSEKKWAVYTCWNEFIPDISLNLEMYRMNQNNTIEQTNLELIGPIAGDAYGVRETTEEIINPDWSVKAEFDISLELNAAMGFRVYQTIIDYKKGKTDLENAQIILKTEIKKNFYYILMVQQEIELFNSIMEKKQARYETALKKYESGKTSEYEKLRAELCMEEMKEFLVQTRQLYDLSVINFKNMLGLKNEVSIKLENNLILPEKKYSADELIKKSLNNNTGLKQLKLTIDSIKNQRNIYISLLTPSFYLGWSFDPFFLKDPLTDSWFGDNDYNSESWSQETGRFRFGISIPIDSLHPFSKEQENIINTELQVKQYSAGLKKAIDETENNIRLTVYKLNSSLENIERTGKKLQLVEKVYLLADNSYRVGSITLTEAINMETKFLNTGLELIKEEYNFVSSLSDLNQIINED